MPRAATCETTDSLKRSEPLQTRDAVCATRSEPENPENLN